MPRVMTYTRRQLIQLLGVGRGRSHVTARDTRPRTPTNADVAYGATTIPIGIRSRLIPNINGITMHALEAGYETRESSGGVAGARLP